MAKPRTKQAIGKQNRKRGQDFERVVARELAKVWPEARRNLSQTRTAKKEGGDILGTPFWIETKSGKRVDVAAAWRQAAIDSQELLPACVIYKSGRTLMAYTLAEYEGRDVRVAMTLGDWLACLTPPAFRSAD